MNQHSSWRWLVWLLLPVLLVVSAGLGYLLMSRGEVGDVTDSKRDILPSIIEVIKKPSELFGKMFEGDKEEVEQQGIGEGTISEYVLSYGEQDGVEKMQVKGKIVKWGDVWVDVRTEDGEIFPLQIPEKTVRIRCLPETVTMSGGKVSATRNVYIDMTRSVYEGVLMSTFNAPSVIPNGSDVLVMADKNLTTQETIPRIIAGYGCDNGDVDPLENTNNR